ncbi:MAG: restriction endonuclease subunit S [Plesiomonas sp.]
MGNKLLPWSRHDWYETTWGELVELKYGKALKDYKETTTGFPVYGTNGAVGFNDKPLCGHPGVIIGRKGAYRGVHYSPVPFFVIDTAFYIEPHFDINLRWAYYELLLQDINGLDSGSAIPSTRREDFYALRVKIPPRYIQDKICVLLDSLNNKVNCNRQINQTLEQMAQALFKSWFVDFDPVVDNALDAGFFEQNSDLPEVLLRRAEQRKAVREQPDFKPLPAETRQLFPAAFEECQEPSLGIGGWVPKGWGISALDTIADFQNGLALQKFRPDSDDDEFLPVLKIAQLRQGYCDDSEKARVDIKESCRVYDGDMIFSWSGTLMIDIWTGGNAALNQHLYKVTSKKYPLSFYLYWTNYHLSRFQHIAAAKAVTMGHIKKGDLSDSYCLIPPVALIKAFDSIAGRYIEQSKNVRLQNKTLSNLRDTLLPKLISGALRLNDDGALASGNTDC